MASSIKRRKLRSDFWEFFVPDSNRQSGKCKLCDTETIILTKNGATSGLKTHLQSKHGFEFEGSSQSSQSESEDEVNLRKAVSSLAALDGISFHTIATSTQLRELFNKSGCNGLPFSPTSIRDMVVSFREDKKEEFKSMFTVMRKSGEKFSLILDEWTSCGNRRYLNVNVHSPYAFWNLGLARVSGTFNAEACRLAVTQRLEEFGLDFKEDVTCLITDGAAMMKKLAQISEKQQQLCFSHGIDLAVLDVMFKLSHGTSALDTIEETPPEQGISDDEDDDFGSLYEIDEASSLDFLPEYGDVIKKVRKVVKLFRSSPKNTEVFQSYCQQERSGSFTLSLDVKTCWNSTADMLEKIVRFKNEIQKSLIDIKSTIQLDETDFNVISEMVSALSPIKAAVKSLCRSDSNLIKCDAALNCMLQKLSEQTGDISEKLFGALESRIAERRTFMSGLLNYLHTGNGPSQDQILDNWQSKFPALTRNQLLNSLKVFARKTSPDDLSSNSESDNPGACAAPGEEEDPVRTLDEELNDCIDHAMNITRTRRIPVNADSALTKTIRQEMALFDNGGTRGRILETVYNYLVTIAPSSVESERTFSTANNFCTRIRSRLGDRSLDALVFLKYALK